MREQRIRHFGGSIRQTTKKYRRILFFAAILNIIPIHFQKQNTMKQKLACLLAFCALFVACQPTDAPPSQIVTTLISSGT
jgi:ABC-type transport system involved in cytochrome c biogenesis permease component